MRDPVDGAMMSASQSSWMFWGEFVDICGDSLVVSWEENGMCIHCHMYSIKNINMITCTTEDTHILEGRNCSHPVS